jgi:hypothetical protein
MKQVTVVLEVEQDTVVEEVEQDTVVEEVEQDTVVEEVEQDTVVKEVSRIHNWKKLSRIQDTLLEDFVEQIYRGGRRFLIRTDKVKNRKRCSVMLNELIKIAVSKQISYT